MTAPAPTSRQAWLDALRVRTAEWRSARPLPDFADAPPRLRALAELQGVLFASFVEDTLPGLPAPGQGGGARPVAVWVCDDAGLVAADAMIDPHAPGLVAVAPQVLDAHLADFPDEGHRYHVVFASIARGVPSDATPEAADPERSHDATEGQALVLHVAAVWGPNASHEQLRSFRWEGDELVAEAANERAVFTVDADA